MTGAIYGFISEYNRPARRTRSGPPRSSRGRAPRSSPASPRPSPSAGRARSPSTAARCFPSATTWRSAPPRSTRSASASGRSTASTPSLGASRSSASTPRRSASCAVCPTSGARSRWATSTPTTGSLAARSSSSAAASFATCATATSTITRARWLSRPGRACGSSSSTGLDTARRRGGPLDAVVLASSPWLLVLIPLVPRARSLAGVGQPSGPAARAASPARNQPCFDGASPHTPRPLRGRLAPLGRRRSAVLLQASGTSAGRMTPRRDRVSSRVMSTNRLGRDVFLALAAIGWADGKLDAEEADAIVRTALEEGLELDEISEIEEATKTPIDLSVIDRSAMSQGRSPLRLRGRVVDDAPRRQGRRDGDRGARASSAICSRSPRARASTPTPSRSRSPRCPRATGPHRYDLKALRDTLSERLAPPSALEAAMGEDD